ncbi:MAG: DNRLRE domain-containing protein [Clostridiales Family XIII bacterium]|jgi:hypothetical protein|nr:DNRLRE domain-containing protein [Clostridiales Family XIII bacterium]
MCNYYKKIPAVVLVCVLALGAVLGLQHPPVPAAAATTTPTQTQVMRANATSAWVSQAQPRQNVFTQIDLTKLQVGRDAKGKNSTALVRFDLPAGVRPADVVSATLILTRKEGDKGVLKLGRMKDVWLYGSVCWRDVSGRVAYAKNPPTSGEDKDGRYRFDVTGTVQGWLGSKTDNCGFAISAASGTKKGQLTQIVSAQPFSEDKKNAPALKVVYKKRTPGTQYGRFGYTRQTAVGLNCMTYALRDKDGIIAEDLGLDSKTLENAYRDKGLNAALSYVKGRCFAYIEAHKKALGITSVRVLSSPSDKIDAKKEYVAALRIGFSFARTEPLFGDMEAMDLFDYHFQMRLDDGRWAEKLPTGPSRIVPGSNPDFRVAKYPWDGTFAWGGAKFTAFYTSKAVYFAVEKNTDAFTSHKKTEAAIS